VLTTLEQLCSGRLAWLLHLGSLLQEVGQLVEHSLSFAGLARRSEDSLLIVARDGQCQFSANSSIAPEFGLSYASTTPETAGITHAMLVFSLTHLIADSHCPVQAHPSTMATRQGCHRTPHRFADPQNDSPSRVVKERVIGDLLGSFDRARFLHPARIRSARFLDRLTNSLGITRNRQLALRASRSCSTRAAALSPDPDNRCA
jgi:hypothetical protein